MSYVLISPTFFLIIFHSLLFTFTLLPFFYSINLSQKNKIKIVFIIFFPVKTYHKTYPFFYHENKEKVMMKIHFYFLFIFFSLILFIQTNNTNKKEKLLYIGLN